MWSRWGPFWGWIPVHLLEVFRLHTGRDPPHWEVLAGPPSTSLPTQKGQGLVWLWGGTLSAVTLSNAYFKTHAWINSYLKWIIHSLISRHLVASGSSITGKLKGARLTVTQNQQKSRLPTWSPSLCTALRREQESFWKHRFPPPFRPF